MKVEFYEKQKFTQWWLWLLLTITGILPIIGVFSHLVFPEVEADSMMDNSTTTIFAAVMVVVILLFLVMNLTTDIDQKKIKINFYVSP